MQPEIIVSNMTAEDVDEVIQLGLSTPELKVTSTDLPVYYSKEDFSNLIKSPNDIYLVAKIDGKLAGYRTALFNPYLREAYMVDIVVKPEFRGMGVATALYKRTFEILSQKGCQWAWALVQEGNSKAEGMLEKNGFAKGRQFTFYAKGAPF